jgi:hypothetical protein
MGPRRPLADAIAAEGSSVRSLNMRLCVDDPNRAGACDKHVVTGVAGLTDSDPAWRADFLTPIVDWVDARLAD